MLGFHLDFLSAGVPQNPENDVIFSQVKFNSSDLLTEVTCFQSSLESRTRN